MYKSFPYTYVGFAGIGKVRVACGTRSVRELFKLPIRDFGEGDYIKMVLLLSKCLNEFVTLSELKQCMHYVIKGSYILLRVKRPPANPNPLRVRVESFSCKSR